MSAGNHTNNGREDPGSGTPDALPIAPSLGPTLAAARVPRPAALVDRRVVLISGLAILVAFVSALIARVLTALIGWVTNLAFFGRFSTTFVSPAGNHLGAWVIVIPVIGGVI